MLPLDSHKLRKTRRQVLQEQMSWDEKADPEVKPTLDAFDDWGLAAEESDLRAL